MALALYPFGANDRAYGPRYLCGAVRTVIVIDVDVGLEQRRTEIGKRLDDCRFFVMAGQDNCDLR